MKHNKRPHLVMGNHVADVTEFFEYQSMPVKLPASSPMCNYAVDVNLEPRLKPFESIIGAACCNFIGEYGLDRYVKSYVYVTAKNQYQPEGNSFNRPGWHCDGFGTDDVSYIWSSRQSTIFNSSDFNLSEDEQQSMIDMQEQALLQNNYFHEAGSLLRMDQFTVHKVGEVQEGVRCFLKVVFSDDLFDLLGNTINYQLQYPRPSRPRSKSRNVTAPPTREQTC